jgi:5,10-methylenetetrahydrofolate reductase
MAFRDVVDSGAFVVTAELGSPLDPVAEPVRSAAAALAQLVNAANVTDNQAATVKLAPIASAVWMLEQGLEPIMQVTTRDRNVLALQSELLGAWALGVRNVLALSGDPLKVGRYAQVSKAVSEFDSLGLVRLIKQMNAGRLAAGETLSVPTGFLVASAINPLVDSPEKVERKRAVGSDFFQTNIVYDAERFAEWFGPLAQSGVLEGAPVLVGVMPPRSTAALEHMHRNIPGVEVNEDTFARLRGLAGEDAKAAGVAVAADLIKHVRTLPGVSGVHIMAPGWEVEGVTRVTEAAGLRDPAQQAQPQ